MKRRISFGITLLLMLSLLLLALTACGDKECDHTYQGAVTKAATCESDGVMTYTCSLCTDSYTEAIPALGHDEIPHEAKAPTCTEIGWDTYVTCSRCDYSTYVEKPALTHDEQSHEAKAPTCTEIGWDAYVTCSRCDYSTYVEKAALTHDEIKHDAKVPTCTEIGWDAYVTCSRCDYTTYVEKAALTHDEINHDAKAPTCTEIGWDAYVTCSRCDYTTYAEKAALTHDEIKHDAKAPTCTEIGWDAYVTCSRCDYTTYAPIEETGHSHDAVVTKPTCTEKGYTTHTCHCGDTYVDTYVDALGHTEVKDEAVAPTCTKTGLTEGSHCSVCNTVLVEQKTVEKLDHDYSEELICNSTHHYYECECGSRKDEEKHISSGAPTATQDEVCTVCGYVITKAVGITFKTLTVNGNNVYGKVSSDTEVYSFINEVNVVGGAKYVVSFDISGRETISTKTLTLNTGDNTVYIIEYVNDEPVAVYKVVIRRKPVYTVTFDANGGTAVETVTVDEDTILSAPVTTYAGYTFTGWDYDFSAPIMSDTHITANWKANTDTKYTVEYYLENLDKSEYELVDTDELAGTTDTAVEALIKEFEHFTFNSTKSVVSGNIDGDGNLVLKVYYTRDTYTINTTVSDAKGGTVTVGGTYPYGTEIKLSTTVNIGYTFKGYFIGENKVCAMPDYIFTVSENLNIIASIDVRQEMANFNFTSISTFCTITGIKDKTVTEIIVPDYVTAISGGAFSGCSNLKNLTIPFVGGSKRATSASSSTLFGYIFGTSSYTGGVYTKQYYDSGSYSTYYIPSSLKSVTVTGVNILRGAFYNCTSLKSVTIGNSVTNIGFDAFYNCTSLTSVYITDIAKWCGISFGYYANPLYYAHNLYLNGELVTELEIPDSVTNIGNHAFAYCSNLTSVTIPDSVETLGEYAFGYCSELSELKLGNSIKLIGFSAFSGCASLTSVIIPDGVVSLGDYAFYRCTSLTSITIPDSVTSIGDSAFRDCTSLNSVTIGNSVKSIGSSAFYGCTSLTSITIPDSITSIGNSAFDNCTSLTSITIPDSVTSIGNSAFDNCTSLTSVTIGNSVTSIDKRAFDNCTALEEIYFNATAMNDLSFPNQAFHNAGKNGDGIKVVIGANVTKIPAYLFDTYSSSYSPKITSVEFDEGSVCTSIVERAFSGCISLTSVTIPDSVETIGEYAFAYCSNLSELTLGNSIEHIGSYAFEDCTSLTSVTIPDSVVSLGSYAFYNCTSLKSVTIGNSVTSIGFSAFEGCASLTSVIIPDSVTSIGSDAFSGCTNLIQIENGVHYVDKWVVDCDTSVSSVTLRENTVGIADGAFYYCDSLTSVIIGNSVTSIGFNAFEGCNNLTSVTIGNSVTSIGDYAFAGCTSLTSINVSENNTAYKSIDGNLYSKDGKTLIKYAIGKTDSSFIIPNGVTTIGSSAFYGCTSLTSVTIGNSVTSIGNYAFYSCTSLTSIKYRGTSSQWNWITKGSYWNQYYSNGNDYKINYTMTYNYKGA